MNLLMFIAVFMSCFLLLASTSEAIYDPLSRPNNKIGIHILFADELSLAAELVNSGGGEWGYVTVPIQAGDRDLVKWQKFMDEARSKKLIPLVRLATEGDYFLKSSWRKPTENDVIDFANFLNSLDWPTKNRYVIVFNEVNRADEWQGQANPEEYAKILDFTVQTFKAKSNDFFIISSGLDNAAESTGATYNQYDFLAQMNEAVPGIFDKIDGLGSHAYPNPAFSSTPDSDTPRSIRSFQYELDTLSQFTSKKLPVFITETNWTQENISPDTIARYYKEALDGPWNSDSIVAITPFILKAGAGPFSQFSFINEGGEKNQIFKSIESRSKTKGQPALNEVRRDEKIKVTDLPVKSFRSATDEDPKEKTVKAVIRWIVGI